ncbi:PilZ domain-containing protein [Sphingobium sp. TB-6]|uniref:PilZ domain-containing protein n=1 Tax=Sphingobium sp. TB-6 TaxID=2728850 RepID=UPI003211E751
MEEDGLCPEVARAYDRARRLLKAQMVHERAGRIDILVRDVSERGLGGKCAAEIAVGDRVTIQIADCDPVNGTVMWRKGHGFGVHLDSPIRPADLRHRDLPATQYQVPTLFRPTLSFRRPGFGSRR